MPTLIITRGLPGAGKTSWARSWVRENPDRRARVNRDDLRGMLHNGDQIPADQPAGITGTEHTVVGARNALLRRLLEKGRDVVCDDTNLPQRVARELRAIARDAGATFEVHDLRDVPLELCLDRNARRSGRARVPDGRIRELHRKYIAGQDLGPLPPEPPGAGYGLVSYVPLMHLPTAYLVDVDGTVALLGDRSPYDATRVLEDRPNWRVCDLVTTLHAAGHQLVFCSGRMEAARPDTETWINRWLGISRPVLHMRADGDLRRDSIVKMEIFDQHIRHAWRVLGVFDDRRQVVDAWRAIGLTCFQVAPGEF